MQVLADSEIQRLMDNGFLIIDPWPDDTKAFQPASVDLTLGKIYRQRTGMDFVKPGEPWVMLPEDERIELAEEGPEPIITAGTHRILETVESVKIPGPYWAQAMQRSRFGRILADGKGFGFPDEVGQYMKHLRKPKKIRYGFTPHVDIHLHPGERCCQLFLFDPRRESVNINDAMRKGQFYVSDGTVACGDCGSIMLHADEVYTPRPGITLDPYAEIDMEQDFERVYDRYLPPRHVYIVKSRERFKFSDRVAGVVESTLCEHMHGRQNHMHSCFGAGYVDPGFGDLDEDSNLTMQAFCLWGKMDTKKPMGSLSVYGVWGAVERPYGLISLGSSNAKK